MEVEDRVDRRISDALRTGLGNAPPLEHVEWYANKARSRYWRAALVACLITAVLGTAIVWIIRSGSEVTVTAGERDAVKGPEVRAPRAIKDDVIDALIRTAPTLLVVIAREDDRLDASASPDHPSGSTANPELHGRVLWGFADPARHNLDRPPAGAEEWMRGDPGGGLRAVAFITVTPRLDASMFTTRSQPGDTVPLRPSDTPCPTCHYVSYKEIPNSYVQWVLVKDDVQINVSSERPEVWPEMRAWLDRFATELEVIAAHSRPTKPLGDLEDRPR